MGNTSSSLPLRFPPFPLLARLLRISRQALKYAHPGHVVHRGPVRGVVFFFLPPRAITCRLTSRRCRLSTHSPHSHFEEAVARDRPFAVRPLPSPPLKTNKTKRSKNARKTLDDTPLNMGPPGDRTRHTSTERTEDFRWIVDLS